MSRALACRIQLSGDVEGEYVVTALRSLTLGRDADVKLNDPSASRIHSRIQLVDGALTITDLGSKNGTLVNGRAVEHGELADQDTIRIGQAVIQVRVEPTTKLAVQKTTTIRPTLSAFDQSAESSEAELMARRLEAEGFTDLVPQVAADPFNVFDAKRVLLEQQVTLKVLDTSRVPEVVVERFLREARIAARLNHPHIVRLFDARSAANLMYMVFERASGRTLLDEIVESERLTPARALAVALPIARALVYAHNLGVIHRDIRPSCILLTEQGVKLSEFGLAKSEASKDNTPVRHLTGPRQAIGMEGYAAPEQLLRGSAANAMSDLYALGATLYHALTGRPPLPKGKDRVVPPIAEVRKDLPPALSGVVDRCLKKEAVERFWGAAEVVHRLEAGIREAFGLGDAMTNVDLLLRFGPRGDDPEAESGAKGEDAAPVFHGRFSRSELMEIAQLVDVNAKSGRLVIRSEKGMEGFALFQEGRATKARYRKLEGQDALLTMLSLPAGTFRLEMCEVDEEPEHRLPIGPILMEVVRRQDESARG